MFSFISVAVVICSSRNPETGSYSFCASFGTIEGCYKRPREGERNVSSKATSETLIEGYHPTEPSQRNPH